MKVFYHSFNKLPPKPEYLKKIQTAFAKKEYLSEQELIKNTKLTKTQVLCALEELINRGEVVRESKSSLYRNSQKIT